MSLDFNYWKPYWRISYFKVFVRVNTEEDDALNTLSVVKQHKIALFFGKLLSLKLEFEITWDRSFKKCFIRYVLVHFTPSSYFQLHDLRLLHISRIFT